VSTVKINYEVNRKQVEDADKALKALDETTKDTKDSKEDLKKSSFSLGDEMKNLANRFSIAGKGLGDLTTGMLSTTSSVGKTTKAMRLLKIAIVSTGIGLLVVALGSLAAFFTKSQKGSDLLSKGLARLSAITDVLIGRAVDLGEKLVNAFSKSGEVVTSFGKFIQEKVIDPVVGFLKLIPGMTTVFEAVGNVVDKVSDRVSNTISSAFEGISAEMDSAVKGADRLSKALINVREKEIAITASTAKRAKQIQDLLIVTRDFTQTFEDQQKALAEANRLELQNQKDLVDFAKLKLEVARAEVEETPKALQTDEQRLAVAQAQAEVYREQAASTAKQREILNRVNELTTRQVASEQKILAEKKAQEGADDLILAKKREVNQELKIIDAERRGDLEEAEMLRRELLLESEDLLLEEKEVIIQASEDRILAIKQQAADKDVERQKYVSAQTISVIGSAFATIAQFQQLQVTNLENQMEREIAAAGNTASARERIENKYQAKLKQERRKAAITQKLASLFEIGTNTAVGISAALKWGIPLGPIFAAIIGGLGAAQVGIVAATPLPKFADGVINLEGGIKGKDSIPSLLMPGESVMTTKETRAFLPTLTAIRKGYVSPELLNSISSRGGGVSVVDATRIIEVPRDSISIDEDGMMVRTIRKTAAITRKTSKYKC
jgi:hypothetical protein